MKTNKTITRISIISLIVIGLGILGGYLVNQDTNKKLEKYNQEIEGIIVKYNEFITNAVPSSGKDDFATYTRLLDANLDTAKEFRTQVEKIKIEKVIALNKYQKNQKAVISDYKKSIIKGVNEYVEVREYLLSAKQDIEKYYEYREGYTKKENYNTGFSAQPVTSTIENQYVGYFGLILNKMPENLYAGSKDFALSSIKATMANLQNVPTQNKATELKELYTSNLQQEISAYEKMYQDTVDYSTTNMTIQSKYSITKTISGSFKVVSCASVCEAKKAENKKNYQKIYATHSTELKNILDENNAQFSPLIDKWRNQWIVTIIVNLKK